jgi:stage V sporulation protein G
MMQVTSVQVYLIAGPEAKVRATARVVLDDSLQLTDLRVLLGANGLFVSYPNDPTYKGEDYRSLFYPITKELREHIEECVLIKYSETKGVPDWVQDWITYECDDVDKIKFTDTEEAVDYVMDNLKKMAAASEFLSSRMDPLFPVIRFKVATRLREMWA